MSVEKRNDVIVVAADPSTADVLRQQALVVLESNHYFFEEILEFGPEAQHALSVIYRDAFAVLDAVGWRKPEDPDGLASTVDVPLAAGFREQLQKCRYELGRTNLDRLTRRDAERSEAERARIDAEIEADRRAAIAIDGLYALRR